MHHRVNSVRLAAACAFLWAVLVPAVARPPVQDWEPLAPVSDRLGGPVTKPTDGDPSDPAIPEPFRLTPRDTDYLPYLKEWEVLPELRALPLTEELLAKPETPILLGDDGFTLTVGQLRDWLWASGRSTDFGPLLQHRPDVIERAMRESSFIHLVTEEAVERGYADSAGVRTDMRFARERILRPAMYDYAMRQRGRPITDQMVELTYEREKVARFRRPLGFEAQQIFLMAYTRYEVAPGDSDLREIAARLTGSERAVTDIRADDARKMRRWVPDTERDRLAFSPVSPGERLLVPMDEGGMEALAGKAVEIERRLEAGEEFAELAREFSDDPHPGETLDSSTLQGDMRLLSEIRRAINDTEPGGTTPFIRTPHGFLKLKILSKRPESFAPLEEVDDQIRHEMQRAEIQRVAIAFLDDLRSSPTVTVHETIIHDTADKVAIPLDTVIARVEGEDLTFGEIFANDGLRAMFSGADAEGRIRLLKNSRVFNDPLFERFSRDHGLYDDPNVAGKLDYYHEFAMAKRVAADYILDNYHESTPLLYRFYVDNPELFRQREGFRLRLIEKIPPQDSDRRDEVLAALADLAGTLTTEEEFARAAQTVSDDPARREQGGLTEELYWTDMTPEFRAEVEGLEAGALAGPFQSGNRFYLVWVVERRKDSLMPFEKAFRSAAIAYENRVKDNLRKDYMLRKLREKNVRVNPDLPTAPAADATAADDVAAAADDGAADETAGATADRGQDD